MNGDEVVCFAHGDDGKKYPMNLSDIYATIREMTKIAYFDFMIRCSDGGYEQFRAMHMNAVGLILEAIHDKYEDHIEGKRREIGNPSIEPTEEEPDG